ncbi:sulfatase [Halosquirtibacter xylanolyticus]|uniref:sulfatase family protein n=1 Tax=Halosquirtibacter xylanolyticus TaxID=3374599 RepID=UPI003747B9EF|nr:sulfatase [Prolixibacteraceae bacterium]
MKIGEILINVASCGLCFAIPHVAMSQKTKSLEEYNVVVFTADDLGPAGMGLNSFGGEVKELTPHLDSFAKKGVRFRNAHVNSAICMPSRGTIATGQYGFHSGHHGFIYANEEVPTMMEQFQASGYQTGVLGKVAHSSAKFSTRWDYYKLKKSLGSGRNPDKYYHYTKEFIQNCQQKNEPFYLMVNSHDPHRPYYDPQKGLQPGASHPSKVYSPDEVFIPKFLADLPQVRREMSQYYSSTRRLDDTFKRVMDALSESSVLDHTIVIFLSDNGIAMPFSKANCYLKSTQTSMFVYAPSLFKPHQVKDEYVSTIDLYPTIMDLLKLSAPKEVDGASFLPLLKGKHQRDRNSVFTQIDYINRAGEYPMRCIQDKSYGYIFNPWSDGKRTYHNANEGKVLQAMKESVEMLHQKRVDLFRYRAVEEFYDLKSDPDCLNNLIDNPRFAKQVRQYRDKMRKTMKRTNDPLISSFELLNTPEEMYVETHRIYTEVMPFRKGDNRKYEKSLRD